MCLHLLLPCGNSSSFKKNGNQEPILSKITGQNYMLAIQQNFTTSNMLNAGCLMTTCFMPLPLLGESIPLSDHTQASGHSLTAPLNFNEKRFSVYWQQVFQTRTLSPKELLNYIAHNLQGTIPTPHMGKTKQCNRQDAADRFLRLYFTLPRNCLYTHAQTDSHWGFTCLLAFSLSGFKLMGVRTMSICATLRTIFYVTQIKI